MAHLTAVAASVLLLSACGGGSQEDAESVRNDTARQEALIANQAKALQAEAENGTRVIEQALENETANVFENREALLNQSAGDTAPADNAAR
jgi:phosphohistidine swiveling domain-containing protein